MRNQTTQFFLALRTCFQGQARLEKCARLQPGEGEEGLGLQDQAVWIEVAPMGAVMPCKRAQGALKFWTLLKVWRARARTAGAVSPSTEKLRDVEAAGVRPGQLQVDKSDIWRYSRSASICNVENVGGLQVSMAEYQGQGHACCNALRPGGFPLELYP